MRIGKLRIDWARGKPRQDVPGAIPDSIIHFQCSVCGSVESVASRELQRETPSCHCCGSTVRFRSIALHLLRGLGFGEGSLADLPVRKDVSGIGLSDWCGYSDLLAAKFDYTNTYYHDEPRLDICNPPARLLGTCDFVISSDVFEHAMPPSISAFRGAASLLKPGGLLVLTVPFVPNAHTVEHYPDATGYEVDQHGKVWIDSAMARYPARDPVLHGGPGATLEMRVFGSIDLVGELEAAGFEDIVLHAEACLEAGILHRDLYSLPITARKR